MNLVIQQDLTNTYFKIMRTKEEFHKLIDKIEDEEVLKGYYELILRLNTHETGKLLDSLTVEEKKELDVSYQESFNYQNILSHEEVKMQHIKWLKNSMDKKS